jgi:putative zinc finger/helix-turn-helix YgiT family protein
MYTCSNGDLVQEDQTRVVVREETFPVKGEPITISTDVRVCDKCGEDVYDRQLDSASLLRAFDVYRSLHGLVSPSDIKAIRENYGLTQRGLSNLLGMGEVTIHRYESGSIPDEVHNQLLRMVKSPWNMQKILKTRGGHLPESQRKKVSERVEQLIREECPDKIIELASASVKHKGPDIYTGYLPFQPEKLMDMIAFFASDEAGVYKTKMNKLLWYTDFLHYRYFGVSISGTPYVHLPYGPVADQYNLFLSYLIQEERIRVQEVFFATGSGELLVTVRPENPVFSSSEMEVLKSVRAHFRSMTSKDISFLSHEEEGYVETKEGQTISYHYADRLKVDLTPSMTS